MLFLNNFCMQEIFNLLIHEKPFLLFINLSQNLHKITKELDITYAYASKVVKLFREKNLIKQKKQGKIQYYTYTPKGKLLRDRCIALYKVFN